MIRSYTILLEWSNMLPDIVGLIVYLFLFLAALSYTYDKPKKRDPDHDDHDEEGEPIDNEYDGKDAINTGKFTGTFGALARKYGSRKSDQYEGTLHYAAQIRSHPKHKESKAILKERLVERYNNYLREGGR